jgi:hypothetical protein
LAWPTAGSSLYLLHVVKSLLSVLGISSNRPLSVTGVLIPAWGTPVKWN